MAPCTPGIKISFLWLYFMGKKLNTSQAFNADKQDACRRDLFCAVQQPVGTAAIAVPTENESKYALWSDHYKVVWSPTCISSTLISFFTFPAFTVTSFTYFCLQIYCWRPEDQFIFIMAVGIANWKTTHTHVNWKVLLCRCAPMYPNVPIRVVAQS